MEPMVGVGIIQRTLGDRRFHLNRSSNVFIFVVAAIVGGLISSVFGATTLGISGVIPWNQYVAVWVTWFIGDTAGIILVVPFIWACAIGRKFDLSRLKIIEAGLVFFLLLIVIQFIFAQHKVSHIVFIQPFYLLPVLIWAAFRLDLRLITGAVILICVFAVWETINGNGPFISNSLNDSLLNLQIFICIVSITMVILSSTIAEKKAANVKILASNKMLEAKVEERVVELKTVNEELAIHKDRLQEMVQDKTLELQQKNIDIAKKASELEEANIALKVLLNQRDKDKQEFEKKIIANLNNFVLPYIQKINIESLDDQDKLAFTMVSNGLNDIFSTFATRLYHAYSSLTPREMQVASLISEGKVNKEISDLLGLSVRSVETHRDNIRGKLGIKGKRVNLRNYLRSKALYP